MAAFLLLASIDLFENCVICLDNLTSDDSIALECRHQFHKKCIELWMKKNSICPLCRNKLQIDNLNKNYSLNDQDNSNYQNSLLDINLRNLWDIQRISLLLFAIIKF